MMLFAADGTSPLIIVNILNLQMASTTYQCWNDYLYSLLVPVDIPRTFSSCIGIGKIRILC